MIHPFAEEPRWGGIWPSPTATFAKPEHFDTFRRHLETASIQKALASSGVATVRRRRLPVEEVVWWCSVWRCFAILRSTIRAAKSAALNVAESAGRTSPADRCRVFGIARGEATEAAAAVEIAVHAGDADPAVLEDVLRIADRLIGLLTGLAR